MSIDGDFDLDGLSGPYQPQGDAPLTPEEKDQIDRINSQSGKISDDLSSDKPIPAHLSAGNATESKSYNLAYEVLNIGLQAERRYNDQLQKHAGEAKGIQGTIENLIDLSGKFAVHMDGDNEKALSDDIHAMCQELKENGIEILQGDEGKMSRDRMAEVKAHISSHTDRLKTDLQKKFTTEIQVKINELHSILDCLKTIEKYASRLNETCVRNQRAGG